MRLEDEIANLSREIARERSDVAEQCGRELELLELQLEDDVIALRLLYARHRKKVEAVLTKKLQDLARETSLHV